MAEYLERRAVRLAWTLVTLSFWTKAQVRRLFRKGAADADQGSNIHTPLVMFLALIPGIGGVAYLASGPLRSKLLARLMFDQLAWKLPFKLYRRTHIGRWLAPPARTQNAGAVPVETS